MPKASGAYNLEKLHPQVASQWHPSRNGNLSPRLLTPGSGRKVWWRCRKGHEWETSVRSRTRGSGCPHCRRAMRWTGRYSRRETCPGCQKTFIILHDEGETFQVAPDSGGAVAEMIYDWLMPDSRNDDDDEAQGEVPQLESKTE